MLKGVGASKGFGIGKAIVIKDINLDYSAVKYTSAQEEKARLEKAVDDFTIETRKMAENLKESAGEKEAEILEGHIVMLNDPFMISQMKENIDGGAVAESAGDTVCTMFYDLFAAVEDEMMRQRFYPVNDKPDK
jgi:phosphotransferase system enzyme I (PtsI)